MRRLVLLAIAAILLAAGAQLGASFGPRALVLRLPDRALAAYLLRDGRMLVTTTADWRTSEPRLMTIDVAEAGRLFNSLEALPDDVLTDAAITFAFDDGPVLAAVERPEEGFSNNRDLAALADALLRTIRMGNSSSLPAAPLVYRATLAPASAGAETVYALKSGLLPLDAHRSRDGARIDGTTLSSLRRALTEAPVAPLVRIDGSVYRLTVWADPLPGEVALLSVDPALTPSDAP